jgi:hypothetical protein
MGEAYSQVFRKISEIIESGVNPLTLMKKLNEIEGVRNPLKDLEDFIVALTCDKYKVKRENILTTNYLSNEETPPRDMIIVLLKKHMPQYSVKRIAELCKKKPPVISIVTKAFSQMGTKVKHEREFLETYTVLSDQIEGFKEAQSLEN